MIKVYIEKLSVILITILALSSCDLERLEPATTTAEGGGTIETYTAYTINSTDPTGSNVYGRVVFWKTDLDQTLVQISMYNTIAGELHPAMLIDGVVSSGSNVINDLGNVNGDTGELDVNKFVLISDTSFYDSLSELDAHITIQLSGTDSTIVAEGNIGINAEPVEEN